MGIGAFAKVAAKPASKSKSKTPEVSHPELNAAIEQWVEAYQQKKNAESQLEVAEAAILPVAENDRVNISANTGEAQSSVRINDKILVTQSSRYTNVSVDNMPKLTEIFGDDTARYFKTKLKIELSEAALADESVLNQLIAAVGEDKLDKFFKVSNVLEVTDAFHQERSTNKAVQEKFNKAADGGLVRPYKAAVKIA